MRLEWLVHDMTSSEHNSRAKKRRKKLLEKWRERTNDDKKEACRKRKPRTGRGWG